MRASTDVIGGNVTLSKKNEITITPSIIQKLPIPSIDLSSLGGSYGIPKGTVLELHNGTLTHKNNHIILSGDLQ